MSASIYLSREEHLVMQRMTLSRTYLGEEKVIDWLQVPISRAPRQISKLGFVSDIRNTEHEAAAPRTLRDIRKTEHRAGVTCASFKNVLHSHIYICMYLLVGMNVNDKPLIPGNYYPYGLVTIKLTIQEGIGGH